MSVKPTVAIASKSECFPRGDDVRFEFSNRGELPRRLVVELFVDCIVLVRIEVRLFVADQMKAKAQLSG